MSVRPRGPLPDWKPRTPRQEGILADLIARYEQHEREDTLPRGGRGIFYDLRPDGMGNGITYRKPDAEHPIKAKDGLPGFGPMEAHPAAVQEVLVMARRAGLIPEEWVADTRAPDAIVPLSYEERRRLRAAGGREHGELLRARRSARSAGLHRGAVRGRRPAAAARARRWRVRRTGLQRRGLRRAEGQTRLRGASDEPRRADRGARRSATATSTATTSTSPPPRTPWRGPTARATSTRSTRRWSSYRSSASTGCSALR